MVIFHQGGPQGSIPSPLLLNYYVSTYPDTTQFSTSYANDFTAFVFDPKVEQTASSQTRHAQDVAGWVLSRNFQVSTSKSTVTLFTPEVQQSHLHPKVPFNGTIPPTRQKPQDPRRYLRPTALLIQTHKINSK